MWKHVKFVFSQLYCDHSTGEYSHSRVWASIANIVATFIIIYVTLHGQLTFQFFISYIGIIGGYTTFAQFFSWKYGSGMPAGVPAGKEDRDEESSDSK